jgi:dTDP-4-dehydrorhamnose 3,5-epimerase
MEFLPTRLPEVVLIKPRLYADERGYFLESWQELRFAEAGIRAHFVQDNHSHSRQFILRGLHYQVRNTQGKLVRVTHGSVYDVVVDMRRSSPQYGKWVGVELSADNHLALWVPPGFAHGYLTLSEDADFLYKCTDYYAPQHERAVRWNDPRIGVKWPLPEGVTPLLSPKDAVAPLLTDAECFS